MCGFFVFCYCIFFFSQNSGNWFFWDVLPNLEDFFDSFLSFSSTLEVQVGKLICFYGDYYYNTVIMEFSLVVYVLMKYVEKKMQNHITSQTA